MSAPDRTPDRSIPDRSKPPRQRGQARRAPKPSGDAESLNCGGPAELFVLRLQQQAGNAVVAKSLENQPQRRKGRVGPPPRRSAPATPATPRAPPGAVASRGSTSTPPAAQPEHAEPERGVGGREPDRPVRALPAEHPVDLETARAVEHPEGPRGDGPSAEEGAAQLSAARTALDQALNDCAVASPSPGTRAGATIVGALTEGGQAARSRLAGAVGDAANAMQTIAVDAMQGLAETETTEVSANIVTDRQAGAAVAAAVGEMQSAVASDQRSQAAQVAAWSGQATRVGTQGVAEESNKVRRAGQEQSRQTFSAGVETGRSTATELATAASRTAAGVGASRGGDVAQAYDQVDSQISGDTAVQMRNASVQAQIGMQNHAAQAASAVQGVGDQAAAAVRREAGVLGDRLAATSRQAGSVLAQTAGEAGQHLGRQGTAAVRQLAAAAAGGRQALRARGDQARGAVAAGAAGQVRRLVGQARRAMGSSRRSQAAAARRLRSVRLGSAAAAGTAESGRQHLMQQIEEPSIQAAGSTTGGTAALGEVAAELGAALRSAGGEQRAGLADGGAKAGAGARRLAGVVGQALGRVTTQARSAGDGLIAATTRGLGAVAGTAAAGLAQATSAVRTGLTRHQADTSARSSEAAADTRRRVGEGQQRLDHSMSGGPAVQRGILGDIVDWVGDQLSDLFDLLKNPGFWVGLIVTVALFPFMGPGAIVVGGAAGGLVSGIHDNVKNNRPWYEPHTIIKHVAIGTFAGAAFAFGGGVLLGLGLEGGAMLGGVMALSGGIGIGVNLATNERWDKGLLANLFLGWLFHKAGGSKKRGTGEGEGQTGRGRTGQERAGEDSEGTRTRGEDESTTGKPRPVPTAKPAVLTRAQALVERIVRLQQRSDSAPEPDPALQNRLQADLNNARALERQAEAAATDAEVKALERALNAAENRAYESSVLFGRVQITRLLQALTRRIEDLRARIPDRNRVSPDNRAQLTKLQAEIERLTAERAGVEREVTTADSARKIDNLGARAEKIAADLETAEAANRNLLGSPSAADMGISPRAADALRVIAEKAYDPLGDYNRGGDGKVTNHYAAARKEAAGQRVGPADPNERPFDHIRDLQNARDAVAGARDALRNEAANPRPGITERGTRVVLEKLEHAGALLRRVDEFLGSIGWPASRPHEWVQENGRWVGQGDPTVIRPRLSGRVNRARDTAEGLDRTILRDVSAARRPALEAERQAIMNEADAINTRLEAAQNEAGLVAEEPGIQQLETRATQLRNDTHE